MTRFKRAAVLILLLLAVFPALSGCWDAQEIDSLFMVTGIALDTGEDPEQLNIAVQVAQLRQEKSKSEEGGSSENESILLTTASDTVLAGLTEINQNSNHTLMLHHNQVILFGMELAGQGIQQHIDLFLRDQECRLEVTLAVVEGRGEEPLAADLDQEPISGIFVQGMFEELSHASSRYRVRLLDFISGTLEESTAPLIPIIRVTGSEDKQEIEITGMAVFKKGRMIGRLDGEETKGYIWSFGDLHKTNINASDGSGKAVFHVVGLNCKRKVSLREDGGVKVSLSLEGSFNINEVSGFSGMKPKELITHLEELIREEIKNKILGSFETAKRLKADIFGFGVSVHQQYPKEWRTMQENWDEVFIDIELDVEVKTKILGTNQIIQSLEMEENMKNENR